MMWLYRLLTGTVFDVAGQMKLYDSSVGYTSSHLPVLGVNVMPWLGAVEVLLGVLVLAGSARCACFSAVPVTPGHALLLDVALLLGVALLALAVATLRNRSPDMRTRPTLSTGLHASHPNSVQALTAFLVWTALPTALWAQSASSAPAEPAWRERFLKEYPAAQQRLRDAVARAEGEGRYLLSGDIVNKLVKSRDKMKWGTFKFVTRDDRLRLDVAVAGGGTEPNMSLVLSPGFGFRVVSPNLPGAQISHVTENFKGRVWQTHALYWRDFFPACYLFAEAPLTEWMRRPGFQMETVEAAPDDPGLVRVAFRWDGKDWFPKHPVPEDYQFTGEWLLSPAEDWAIRRTAFRQTWTYPDNQGVEREKSLGTIDVQRIDGLGVVPRRVELQRFTSLTSWDEMHESVKLCEFDAVRSSAAGDEVFAPAALGVPDPRGFNWRFVGMNVVILLLLLLAAWLGWRFWRNRSRMTSG